MPSSFDESFAKIVHARQPVSSDVLDESGDGAPVVRAEGVQLAWDDEDLVEGQNRSLVFFNDTATTEIYPLSLHDALPINDTATTEIYTRSLHDALPISVVAVSFKKWQAGGGDGWELRVLDSGNGRDA